MDSDCGERSQLHKLTMNHPIAHLKGMSALGHKLYLNKVGFSKVTCFISTYTTVDFHPFFPVWICPKRLVGKEPPLVMFTGHVKTLPAPKGSQVKFPCVTSRQHTDSLAHFKTHLRNIKTKRMPAGEPPAEDPLQWPFRNLPFGKEQHP